MSLQDSSHRDTTLAIQVEQEQPNWKTFIDSYTRVFAVAGGVVSTATLISWVVGWLSNPYLLVAFFSVAFTLLFVGMFGHAFVSNSRSIESIGKHLNGELSKVGSRPQIVAASSTIASEPQPNIVCLGDHDGYAQVGEHDVFRVCSPGVESRQHVLGATFCNEPNPPLEIETLEHVEAQIFYYSLDFPERLMFRVHHGYWLNEEYPYVSFSPTSVRVLLLGVKDGIRFTVFDNNHESSDKYLPQLRRSIINLAGYRIRVRLIGGEHREWCKEFEFELRIPSEASYSFQYLSEEVKKINLDFANHQLGKFIDEGERLLGEFVERNEQFYAEATKWSNDVEFFMREFLTLNRAKRFLNITELREYPHSVLDGSKDVLDELYTRHMTLKEIALEYGTRYPPLDRSLGSVSNSSS